MTDTVIWTIERISPNSNSYFDMVAELAKSIVNRANRLWATIVYVHRRILHPDIWPCSFAIGYLCSKLERATATEADNDSDSDDVVASWPTQYHVRALQRSVSTETMTTPSCEVVNANATREKESSTTSQFALFIHIEDYIDESEKPIEASDIRNMQNAYATEGHTQYTELNTETTGTQSHQLRMMRKSMRSTMNSRVTMAIRKKKNEISSISLILTDPQLCLGPCNQNRVHSMIRRIMRTANGFEA
eukprot:5599240-Amphidinium_carterae.5